MTFAAYLESGLHHIISTLGMPSQPTASPCTTLSHRLIFNMFEGSHRLDSPISFSRLQWNYINKGSNFFNWFWARGINTSTPGMRSQSCTTPCDSQPSINWRYDWSHRLFSPISFTLPLKWNNLNQIEIFLSWLYLHYTCSGDRYTPPYMTLSPPVALVPGPLVHVRVNWDFMIPDARPPLPTNPYTIKSDWSFFFRFNAAFSA